MVNPYKAGVASQQWKLSGNHIVSARGDGLVLEAKGGDLGADVHTTKADDNSEFQQWVSERQYVWLL